MDESDFLIRSLFLQGSYSACKATEESSPAASNPALALYAVRSALALQDHAGAQAALKKLPASDQGVKSVTLLAQVLDGSSATPADVVDKVRALLGQAIDAESCTRVVCATVLYLEGEVGESLSVLAQGAKDQDQESVALQIQILLSLSRHDAAVKAYNQAKEWAEDSLLIQLCEAWLSLSSGISPSKPTGSTGSEVYQSAYYVFDEIAQLPSANNVVVLNGKACAQAALGNWPEAEAALLEASQINAEYDATLANDAVLSLPSGKSISAADANLQKLKQVNPGHPLIRALQQKSDLFDEAAAKFKPSVAA